MCRRFRKHRSESCAGVERAVRIVGKCVDEAQGDQAEGGQGKSEVEWTYVRAVQLKDEIAADSKTNQQGTEVVCVVTTTFEENTVRQNSLAVDVDVEEKFLSLDPISSATVRRVIYYLTSGKMKGKRRKVKLMKRSRKSERTRNSCMRHGDDHGME